MLDIKKEFLSFGKLELNTLVITAFLSLMTLNGLLAGNNVVIFLGCLVLSCIFIWLTPQAGILGVLLTTMIFGEHFSLLPLQFNEIIYKFYALDFVLILTFMGWLFKQPVQHVSFKKFFNCKKNLWLSVFFIFIALNLIISIFFKSANFSLAVGTFKNYAYLLLYFLIIAMFNKLPDVIKVIKTFWWGSFLLIGFVFYGWLSGHGLWSEITPGIRYLSGLHSYYLTFGIIITLILLVYKKYILGSLACLLVFLIELSGMIGGMFRHLWLGIVTAFTTIFKFLEFKKKTKFINLGLTILLIILILAVTYVWLTGILGQEYTFSQNNFFNSVLGRGKTLFQTGNVIESAAGWRLATWGIALDKFKDNPLLGIGMGQKFYFEYRGFVDLIDIRNIHNDLASLLVQLGLLGFLPFILFNFYQAKDLLKLIKHNHEELTQSLSLMLLSFWLISMFGIFFAIYLMFNGTSIFYWTVMGLISVLISTRLQSGLTSN